MTHTSTDQPARRPSGAIVPVLAFAGIVVAVMQTLLVPVIKDLPQLLSTEPSNATWVLTSTLLSGAVATPIMGRLGDLYGKRRMLIASLAVMVVGALVSALTSDLLTMIAGRALQGFAMGAIPLGIGLMRDMLPREKLGSAMALMSSSIGVGGGLALPARRPGRPARRLARPLLRRRRPRRPRDRPHPPRRTGVPDARRGHLRRARRDRPLRRPRPLPPPDHQGQRLGLDVRHHARPVRRGGRRPPSSGA
jgi:energy-converting hydrogenase Eha subunit A